LCFRKFLSSRKGDSGSAQEVFMDLKKLSQLNYWQWFGISFIGVLVLSSHSLSQFFELSIPKLLVIFLIYVAASGILAFIFKRYYSKNRITKIFSKNPFKKLIDAGFHINDDHLKGMVDGYNCHVGLSFSESHMMEFVWYELFFINPSKNKDEWNERFMRLKKTSSHKLEWKYNSVRKGFGVIIRRTSYENLLRDIRKTIEILHSADLKSK
jgi:hypothetical protein